MIEEKTTKIEKIEDKKGLMDISLKKCEELGIKMEHVKMQGMSFGMPWNIIIKTVNYLAKSKVLDWHNTFQEAAEMMGIYF